MCIFLNILITDYIRVDFKVITNQVKDLSIQTNILSHLVRGFKKCTSNWIFFIHSFKIHSSVPIIIWSSFLSKHFRIKDALNRKVSSAKGGR